MEEGGKLNGQPASPDGKVYVEELGPAMEVEAPQIGRPNRRAATVDLGEVERLAGLGMKPVAIGPALGMTVSRFRGLFDRAAVRDAYDRGNAKWQETLLKAVSDGVKAGGNPALLIFSLKQMHGTGWADNMKVTQEPESNSEAQQRFLKRKKQEKLKVAPVKLIPMEPTEDGTYTSSE